MFLLLVILFLLGGCGERKAPETVRLDSGSVLDSELQLPTIMQIYGDYLAVADLFSEGKIMKLYDLSSGKIVSEFGVKGEGPGEFLHVSSLDFSMEDGQLMLHVLDPVRSLLTTYRVSELEKGIADGNIRKVSDGGLRLTELYRTDGGYLATGIFTQGKYALFDDSLRFCGYEGAYLVNEQGVQDSVRHAIANNGTLAFSKDKRECTEIIYMASVLNFNRMDGNHATRQSEYVIKPLNYRLDGESIVNNEVDGYLSGSYGRSHIYALYVGVPESDDIATYGSTIHVFSRDGVLEKRMELDRSAFRICVDEDESTLYVLSHDPDAGIWKYSIR